MPSQADKDLKADTLAKRALARQIKLGRKKGDKQFDAALKKAAAARKKATKSRQKKQ